MYNVDVADSEPSMPEARSWIAGCCILTNRDLPSAILLHEIVRFQEITKVEFQGKKWVGLTQYEWMAKTGLSIRQIARATKKLREHGLIEVKPAKRAIIGIRVNHFHVKAPIFSKIVKFGKTTSNKAKNQYVTGEI